MYSIKKSLFGTLLFVLLLIVSVVLFVFSISEALETEAIDPVVVEGTIPEEGLPAVAPVDEAAAAEEAVVAEDPVAEPVAQDPVPNAEPEHISVWKGDTPASSTTDYTWVEAKKCYTILSDGLTFKGDGGVADCRIEFEEAPISNITLNNVNIRTSYNGKVLSFVGNNTQDFTLNIINNCSVTNTSGEFFAGGLLIAGMTNEIVIYGDSSSSLSNVGGRAFDLQGPSVNKITGGISINATSENAVAFGTESECLIFDTSGKVVIDTSNTDIFNGAIGGFSEFFTLQVNNGFLELHAIGDASKPSAAIHAYSPAPSDIIKLGDNVKMVGAESYDAKFADCTEGVYMKKLEGSDYNSLSYIGDSIAGTVFIYAPQPEPTPDPTPGGGTVETYDAAKTGDSIPGADIAIIALVALISFVVMRSRKFNF